MTMTAKGKDNKPHIGIFGRRNVGKSSFINTLINQDIAIVSDQPGTTTDPVKKSIEIFGIGPAILIDTAGIDDEGALGEKRIKKTLEVIRTIDLAVLLFAENRFGSFEIELIGQFENFDVPFVIVHNKSDLARLNQATIAEINGFVKSGIIEFSTLYPENTELVVEKLRDTIPETAYQVNSLIGDLLKKDDIVLLITPIDTEAPDGRMILPQVMAIRDILDNNAVCIVLRETELESFIKNTNIKPRLAVTDSQAFEYVNRILPVEIPLISFSIVFARLRGAFEKYIEGTPRIDQLKDGDKVLILESCTHRVSCDDIGRFKIPEWIKKSTGKNIEFEVVAGLGQTKENITASSLVIQCGGCVMTRKQILNRLKPAIDNNVPVSNYGMSIAYMHGIFDRALAPFYYFE